MEKVLSQKKKIHLLRNGYRFRKDTVMKGGDTTWRCIRRMCCARLRVGVTEVVRNETRKDELTVEQPRQLFQQTSTTTSLPVTSLHIPNGRRRCNRRHRH